jgi:glycosyltransferase involved in cell wall biosynthesis
MKFYYNIEQKLLKLSSIFSNCHIAISYYVKNQLLLKYGINSLVIYHGISYNNQEKLSIIQKQDIRKFLGLPKEKFIILYVGKMNKYKNILTLINSIPLIISSYNNILFILIGSGDLLEEVKQKIIKFNITSYVILIPFSNNLSKYYMIADAFILPSKNEMFGIVLLEAMSHGLPVIASNGGACPEIIGDAGLLFNPDNCKELADTILLLLNDDNLKVTLKSQSLKRAKLFSWDITVNQYLEVYMRNMKI